ncbi:MAG: spermidine synthase [Thermoplasmata archaeon]
MEKQWKWKKFFWKYTLEYDGTVYSIINKRRIFTKGYWDIFLPFLAIFKNPEILMIGLGGGTVLYESNKIFNGSFSMDIVEISQESVEKASEVIDLKNGNIIIGDGFEFLLKNNKKYDIIILDAYKDRKIPENFISENFFLAAFNSLKENGILLVNYALNAYGIMKIKDFKKYAEEYFLTFRIGPTMLEENIIIVCSKIFGIDDIKSRLKTLNIFPPWLKRRVLKLKKL